MVYESDFYTTRRPYRPISTYSVSPLTSGYYLPSLLPYYHDPYITYIPKLSQPLTSGYYLSSLLPYYYEPYVTYIPKLAQRNDIPAIVAGIAHIEMNPRLKLYGEPMLISVHHLTPNYSEAELIYRPTARSVTRLVTYPEPPHHVVRVRVRPSVVLRELDRIAYRHRPNSCGSAVEDFFRAETTKAFEDESRRIRADSAALLHRARSVVPRASSVAPLDTIYSYSYGEPIPYRFSNDAYVARLSVPLRSVVNNIKSLSLYNETAKRFSGRGNLACVHYSGKKAFSNRRPLYKELSIRDDVNLLSFYAKNRLAAAGLAVEQAAASSAPEQPTAAQCA